ncbi:hypothetical protein [Aureivirga sp. CE67]|uniref:hypothetical protein n=1 Tax=Aureivirga sp. CE67 TaxID=1788983 RepID=UPI0018CBEB03|nr:hypothetical protein [Aureivirga sp. CE67]
MLDQGSNMEMVQLVIGIIVLSAFFIFKIKIVNGFFRRKRLSDEEYKFDDIRKVYTKLKKNESPDPKHLLKYEKNIRTRKLLFEVLRLFDKLSLYPTEKLSNKNLSESYLANWLNLNDDFDSFPDYIEFIEETEINEETVIQVYKFRSDEPHIFADKGWMYAYVGIKNGDAIEYEQPYFIHTDFEQEKIPQDKLIIESKKKLDYLFQLEENRLQSQKTRGMYQGINV